jgi:predicted methyltransferase MtxX (methanogen marker protein 4)
MRIASADERWSSGRRWLRVLLMPTVLLGAGLWIIQQQQTASQSDAFRVKVQVQDLMERMLHSGSGGPMIDATDPLMRGSVATRIRGALRGASESSRVMVLVEAGDQSGQVTFATHTALAGICESEPIGIAVTMPRGSGIASVVSVFDLGADARARWQAECEIAAGTLPTP